MLPNNAAKLRKKKTNLLFSTHFFLSPPSAIGTDDTFSVTFDFSPANVRQYFHSTKRFPIKFAEICDFF